MYKLLIILLWAVMSSLFVVHVQAQTIGKLTVEESVKMGLDHNYRLRAAKADAEAAEAVKQQTRAGRLPTIQGRASYTRLSDNIPEVAFSPPGSDTTFTILPVELDRFHTEVSVEQLLFAGGRLNNQIEAADHRADAARLMKKQDRANIAFEIRRAYWSLYSALAAQQILESALARVEEHLKNVRNRVEAGTALRVDLLTAKTRRSEVRLERVETRNRVRVARLELNQLIGLPAETKTKLVMPDEVEPLPFGMKELVKRVLKQRPGLNALLEKVGAREAKVEAIQGKWFPEIYLFGRYVYARPNQYFFAQQDEFRGTWEAGVRLQWNIWSGGQRSAQIREAKARLKSAEARRAYKRERVIIEVKRQYLELGRAAEAIDGAAANVEAAKEALQTTRRQFKAGTVLSEQVSDAQHAYRKAQTRHAKAVADYKIAYAAVLKALGQIWGGDNEI